MAAIFGWFSEASTSASRWNLASRSASVATELGQDLEGDLPLQLGIAGAIHLTHAAHAEQRGNLVGAEATACGEDQVAWIILGRRRIRSSTARQTARLSGGAIRSDRISRKIARWSAIVTAP